MLVGMAAAGSTVKAALIAYDGFETTTGPLNTQSGGSSWSTNWTAVSGINVVANPLTYSSGSVAVNGGSNVAEITGAIDSTSAASRSFAAQSGTVYFSFLFRSNAGTVDVNDFVHFMMNNDAVNTNSGGIGKITTSSTFFGARIGGGNGGDTTDSAATFAAATTYFLVGKVSKVSSTNFNRVELFVNPSSDIEPGSPSVTDNGDSLNSSMPFFSLRTVNMDADDRYQFDELRVGTTFADVVPIPEPSTWMLLIVAGSLLSRRRLVARPIC
jgi:hypothetical protein